MKHYLVTGAAGFIGSAVAGRLIAEGNSVVTIDNLSTGYETAIPNGCRFIKGDVGDVRAIEKLDDQKFDAIFHIAGQSSGEISFESPVYDLQTNTQSTLLLLEYAVRTKCDNFIYAGTMSVYGNQPDAPVCEDSAVIPESFYAVGKAASESYLRIYSRQYRLSCTSLRLFNVYGPGQNMSNLKQGLVSILLEQALRSGKIVVRGDKKRYRDFVYIDDVVEAFILAERNNNNSIDFGKYQCYNICTGKKTLVEDIVKIITDKVQTPVEVSYVSGTPGDQFGIYGDAKKARKYLAWAASTAFSDGFNVMYKWAVEHAHTISNPHEPKGL